MQSLDTYFWLDEFLKSWSHDLNVTEVKINEVESSWSRVFDKLNWIFLIMVTSRGGENVLSWYCSNSCCTTWYLCHYVWVLNAYKSCAWFIYLISANGHLSPKARNNAQWFQKSAPVEVIPASLPEQQLATYMLSRSLLSLSISQRNNIWPPVPFYWEDPEIHMEMVDFSALRLKKLLGQQWEKVSSEINSSAPRSAQS